MSDDSIETPIDQTILTGALRRPPSLLPWVLFGVTGGILAALTIVLIRQVTTERQRADEQAQTSANETARAETAELGLRQLKLKLTNMEEQVAALTLERDELSARVRALALEAAKAPAEPPRPVVKPDPKPPVKKAGKKKKPVKKKRRR